MKASNAAAAPRSKPSPAAADHTPSVADGTALPLLQFGEALHKSFSQQVDDAAAKLPLTRYADYLHHFGFSVERESRARGAAAHVTDDLSKPYSPTTTAAATRAGSSPASRHLINHSSEDPSGLADTADWGISEELKMEADGRCESVGVVAGATDWGAVATQLTAPFSSVTWRQTATQCAIKKARCIYAWLCAHVALQLRLLDEAAGEADGGAVAANAAKPARNAPANKKASRPAKKKEAATAQEPAKLADPLTQAMAARRATPALLAQLYASMLGAVGLKSEVVAGQLKGAAAGEAVEWVWNIVRIDGRSYLVDAAAALYDGTLRSSSNAMMPSSTVAVTTTAASADVAKPPVTAAGGGTSHNATAGDGSETVGGCGAPRLLSGPSPALRRDFFFFTHPCLFLSSHLPTNTASSLVALPTKSVHWLMQPRVTPAFYHFGLQLTSHPTYATISASSAPSYLSLMNRTPGTTELCCVLFSGTLQTLSEDVTRNTPLGPGWVWHQRDDAANIETFTLTVPQAGYYVAVVGARAIRADPYSATIIGAAEAAFTPVVSYEVRIDFTPSGVPVLPRQYFSPSICRLMQPLCAQITPGTQKFSVMPSCSNVLSVAVVRRAVPQQAVPTSSTTAVTNDSSSSGRSLISFLPFQMKRAAFEGFAEVKAGDVIELWVLYAAPDCNGQQLSQRVGAMKATTTETPAEVETKLVDNKKKKAPAAEPHLVGESQLSRLTHALSRGEVFQLFVGSIEVRHYTSSTVMQIIQPQPTVEQEQATTLRRLAGVTDALLKEAEHTAQYQVTPVGSYFGAVAATTTH
jgi:hypothetical protein